MVINFVVEKIGSDAYGVVEQLPNGRCFEVAELSIVMGMRLKMALSLLGSVEKRKVTEKIIDRSGAVKWRKKMRRTLGNESYVLESLDSNALYQAFIDNGHSKEEAAFASSNYALVNTSNCWGFVKHLVDDDQKTLESRLHGKIGRYALSKSGGSFLVDSNTVKPKSGLCVSAYFESRDSMTTATDIAHRFRYNRHEFIVLGKSESGEPVIVEKVGKGADVNPYAGHVFLGLAKDSEYQGGRCSVFASCSISHYRELL